MPKDTKTLGNNKARACESLGFVHKKGCVRVLTQPLFFAKCLILFYRAVRFTGIVMQRAPPPPRGSSEPSMVMTYLL